jgi:hypothetical protein
MEIDLIYRKETTSLSSEALGSCWLPGKDKLELEESMSIWTPTYYSTFLVNFPLLHKTLCNISGNHDYFPPVMCNEVKIISLPCLLKKD